MGREKKPAKVPGPLPSGKQGRKPLTMEERFQLYKKEQQEQGATQ